MAVTETRLLPKTLVDECLRALTRLQFVRNVDRDHPVVVDAWRPHPVDCDLCSADRRLDIALGNVLEAIGKAKP